MKIILISDGKYDGNTYQLCEVICYTINEHTQHTCSLYRLNKYDDEKIDPSVIAGFDIIGIAAPSRFIRTLMLLDKVPINNSSFFIVNTHHYCVPKVNKIIHKILAKRCLGEFVGIIRAHSPIHATKRIIRMPHNKWRDIEETKHQISSLICKVDSEKLFQ